MHYLQNAEQIIISRLDQDGDFNVFAPRPSMTLRRTHLNLHGVVAGLLLGGEALVLLLRVVI